MANTDTKNISKNSLQPGTRLKGNLYEYTIKKVLGAGSFGITYQAIVELEGSLGSIKTKVAIKEFYMSDINGREGSQVTSGNKDGIISDYRKKFIREAKSLGEVNHENIINVMEVFECNGTVYYSMQYIEGGSLDARISKLGHLSESETVAMTEKICSALKTLHDNGMVHLDLKPANIMLSEDLSPILIDFGIAKHFDESGAPESSTKIGAGTPGYSPVEQASYRAGRGVPVTMDIYALGATMYKMLTGKRPPEASNILNGLSDIGSDLDEAGITPQLRDVVVKSMSPLIRERYQNIEEMISVIRPLDSIVKENDERKLKEEEAKRNAEAQKAAKERDAKEEELRRRREAVEKEAERVRAEKERIEREKAEAEARRRAQQKSEAAGEGEATLVVDYPEPSRKNGNIVYVIIGAVIAVALAVAIYFFIVGNKKDKETDSDNKKSEQVAKEGTVTDMNYASALGNCTYTGEVDANGVPHGHGVAKFSTEGKSGVVPMLYDGAWEHGVMEGKAEYTLSNGDTFSGVWKNNRFFKGRYSVKAEGIYYEGEYDERGNIKQGGGHWYDSKGNILPD